jgi:hypothetical protein
MIFDMGVGMSYREKSAWIMSIVTCAAYVVYLAIILGRTENASLIEVSYISTLLWTMGAVIVVAIVAHIVVGIASPKDIDKKDQRDREIYRYGEYIGQYVVSFGALGALGLSMAELDHFWIANVIYLAFVLSTLLGSAAKIVAYRRGFPQW